MSHPRARYALGSAGAALAALAILGPASVGATHSVNLAAATAAIRALATPAPVTVLDAAKEGARRVHDRLPEEIRQRLPEELRIKLTGT